jgi:hypothetical protein
MHGTTNYDARNHKYKTHKAYFLNAWFYSFYVIIIIIVIVHLCYFMKKFSNAKFYEDPFSLCRVVMTKGRKHLAVVTGTSQR